MQWQPTAGWLIYGHLWADCLYTRIISRPNARYRVWEAFTFSFLLSYIYNSIVKFCNICSNALLEVHFLHISAALHSIAAVQQCVIYVLILCLCCTGDITGRRFAFVASEANSSILHLLALISVSTAQFFFLWLIDAYCHCYHQYYPLPSSRHRLSYDECLEDKRENYHNCSVLCSVWHLCTVF